MSDLVEFLTARLDDDWAESLRWSHNIYGPDGSITGLDEAAVRVQRDVEAKRRILEEHDPGEGLPPDLMQCPVCDGNPNHADYPCRTLRLLALPYANHPYYQQEWKL